MKQSIKLIISGLVQGVGFRHATYIKAKELGVLGRVRNLLDGSVEILAIAEKGALSDFKTWCYQGPLHARVEHVEVTEVSNADFLEFKILNEETWDIANSYLNLYIKQALIAK